jgi:hypothetical protein
MPPVVYSCVTGGYDAVAPVDPHWSTRFILFHDGSADVPAGWEGRIIKVPGLSGTSLNRYAKILPHRLELGADRSLYVDGNIFFRRDPAAAIDEILDRQGFAALDHPEIGCPYREIRRAVTLGFVWPGRAFRVRHRLRRLGVRPASGLFECNVLFRRQEDREVIALDEEWWRQWRGGYGRDQPLLVAAAAQTGLEVASLGTNRIRAGEHPVFGITMHARPQPKWKRLIRRLAAEAALFRLWLPA